jgi:hypothetical protein
LELIAQAGFCALKELSTPNHRFRTFHSSDVSETGPETRRLEEGCDLLSDQRANSPGLDHIEMLWAILKYSVATLEPQTIAKLKEVRQQARDTISIGAMNRLGPGFGRRLKLCLEASGEFASKLTGHVANR